MKIGSFFSDDDELYLKTENGLKKTDTCIDKTYNESIFYYWEFDDDFSLLIYPLRTEYNPKVWAKKKPLFPEA